MSLEPAALFEYGHGHVWTVEAIGTYPYALAELPAGSQQCSHPFAPVSWVGFASGDVFAAGPSCGASHHLTVARWRKNSDKPGLLTVSGSHKVAGFFSSIYGESVTSVNAFMPDWNFNHRRSWLAHFDGRHWSNPIVQPDQADTHLARAPQGRQGRLWKYISSAVQAPSGDLWMTGRDHQIDCGYCFMYDALLRVRKRQ